VLHTARTSWAFVLLKNERAPKAKPSPKTSRKVACLGCYFNPSSSIHCNVHWHNGCSLLWPNLGCFPYTYLSYSNVSPMGTIFKWIMILNTVVYTLRIILHKLEAHPSESPDTNPIENVWGSLKQYLRTKYKPRNLDELKQGVETFRQTLTPAVCRRYIGHLYKVIPKIITVNGDPSGF